MEAIYADESKVIFEDKVIIIINREQKTKGYVEWEDPLNAECGRYKTKKIGMRDIAKVGDVINIPWTTNWPEIVLV